MVKVFKLVLPCNGLITSIHVPTTTHLWEHITRPAFCGYGKYASQSPLPVYNQWSFYRLNTRAQHLTLNTWIATANLSSYSTNTATVFGNLPKAVFEPYSSTFVSGLGRSATDGPIHGVSVGWYWYGTVQLNCAQTSVCMSVVRSTCLITARDHYI